MSQHRSGIFIIKSFGINFQQFLYTLISNKKWMHNFFAIFIYEKPKNLLRIFFWKSISSKCLPVWFWQPMTWHHKVHSSSARLDTSSMSFTYSPGSKSETSAFFSTFVQLPTQQLPSAERCFWMFKTDILPFVSTEWQELEGFLLFGFFHRRWQFLI